MQRSVHHEPTSCTCSTSYSSRSQSTSRRNAAKSRSLVASSSRFHESSCWGATASSSFTGRDAEQMPQSRQRLVIEARRRRPDPIVPPFIIEERGGHEDYMDMYQHLLSNRIIFVGSRITDELATNTVAKLLALETLDSSKDIKIYINSPGGAPYAVIGIIDTLKYLRPDVSTVCLGQSASISTLLLAAGTKGKRLSLPSSRIMMHQPIGGAMGSADEVNITTSELNRTMRVVHTFYSEFTGQSIERMEQETDRDNFMSPKQAQELGLIDQIIS